MILKIGSKEILVKFGKTTQIEMCVKAGSRIEDKLDAGISHFVEHLTINQLNIEKNVDIYANTNYARVYYKILPKISFEKFVQKSFGFLKLEDNKKYFEDEKLRILHEKSIRENDIQNEFYKLINFKIYGLYSMIGTQENIKNFSLSQVLEHIKKYYTLQNIDIILTLKKTDKKNFEKNIQKFLQNFEIGKDICFPILQIEKNNYFEIKNILKTNMIVLSCIFEAKNKQDYIYLYYFIFSYKNFFYEFFGQLHPIYKHYFYLKNFGQNIFQITYELNIDQKFHSRFLELFLDGLQNYKKIYIDKQGFDNSKIRSFQKFLEQEFDKNEKILDFKAQTGYWPNKIFSIKNIKKSNFEDYQKLLRKIENLDWKSVSGI